MFKLNCPYPRVDTYFGSQSKFMEFGHTLIKPKVNNCHLMCFISFHAHEHRADKLPDGDDIVIFYTRIRAAVIDHASQRLIKTLRHFAKSVPDMERISHEPYNLASAMPVQAVPRHLGARQNSRHIPFKFYWWFHANNNLYLTKRMIIWYNCEWTT